MSTPLTYSSKQEDSFALGGQTFVWREVQKEFCLGWDHWRFALRVGRTRYKYDICLGIILLGVEILDIFALGGHFWSLGCRFCELFSEGGVRFWWISFGLWLGVALVHADGRSDSSMSPKRNYCKTNRTTESFRKNRPHVPQVMLPIIKHSNRHREHGLIFIKVCSRKSKIIGT